MLKDFYESQGEMGIQGSRDAIRLAFRRGIIENGDSWMDMMKSRALTSHTYNEDVADEVGKAIFDQYYPEFLNLQKKFKELEKNE